MESTQGIADALVTGRMRLVSGQADDTGTWVLELETATIQLSRRELAMLAAAESGAANKRVALDQDLADSTVSETLRMALGKLGFASRTEFVSAMTGLRSAEAKAAGAAAPGEATNGAGSRIAVSMPRAPDPRLTGAERQVASAVLKGDTNLAIAAARRTSARTVANQLAAIYRKLGVSSRWELAARLSRTSGAQRQAAAG